MRVPSTLPTIDAFVIKPKRKRNVWEDAINDKLQLTSTYVPHTPLSPEEEAEIYRCYTLHQRPRTVDGLLSREARGQSMLVPLRRKKSTMKRQDPRERRTPALPEFESRVVKCNFQKMMMLPQKRNIHKHL